MLAKESVQVSFFTSVIKKTRNIFMNSTKPQSAPLNQLSHMYSEFSLFGFLTIFDNGG
jgi:hypothetical protein